MAVIRNVGRTAIPVGLILADGTKASVRVMPRNKGVTLDPGASVDPNWKALKGQYIIEFTDEQIAAAALIKQPEGSIATVTPSNFVGVADTDVPAADNKKEG